MTLALILAIASAWGVAGALFASHEGRDPLRLYVVIATTKDGAETLWTEPSTDRAEHVNEIAKYKRLGGSTYALRLVSLKEEE